MSRNPLLTQSQKASREKKREGKRGKREKDVHSSFSLFPDLELGRKRKGGE